MGNGVSDGTGASCLRPQDHAGGPLGREEGQRMNPLILLCQGVKIGSRGLIVHAGGCNLPCRTNWPWQTHGISDACARLTLSLEQYTRQ